MFRVQTRMKRIVEIVQLYFNRFERVDDFVLKNQMNEIFFVLKNMHKIFIDIFDVVRFVYRLNFIENDEKTFEFEFFIEFEFFDFDENDAKIDFF